MAAPVDGNLGSCASVTLLASTTATSGTNTAGTAVTGLGPFRQAVILLNVTAAAAAAGDTLDVFVDTAPDGGTTWINAIHFTQVLGNGGALKFWAVLDPGGAPGTTVTNVTADAAAGVQRPVVLCDQVRVRYSVVDGGAHGQSFTFTVVGFFRR